MKQLLSLLGSMKSMVILMLIFSFAIGWATFIENDYGTMTAKADIYNAKWFEVLLFFLAVNLTINIFKYKMYTLKKAPIFIFHVAFLIVLLGAAITRYIGYEGNMHIREGDSASTILSSQTYFMVKLKTDDKNVSFEKPYFLSKRLHNSLSASLDIDNKNVKVSLVEYIPNATQAVVEDKTSKPVLQLMVTGGGKGKAVFLKEGEYYQSAKFVLDFNSSKRFDKDVISVFVKDNQLFMKHKNSFKFLKMDTQKSGVLDANDNEKFETRVLYQVDGGGFVLRKFFAHAKTKIVTDPDTPLRDSGIDALRFKIAVGNKSKEMLVYAQEGIEAKWYHSSIDGVDISLAYGCKSIKLPFELYLKDFELKRYPGSMSPASYASEVVLIDKEKNIKMPYRIYMNHILQHRGFRFFQASYDMDEQGTILSVNHDPGTLPSYIGYALMALGLFWSLFSSKNRFAQLSKKAKKASQNKTLAWFLIAGVLSSVTPTYASSNTDIHTKIVTSISKEHADKFAKLIVQDSGGRMKPMDTLNIEILAKLYRGSSVKIGQKTLDANQVVLGMMVRPDDYRYIKMIRTHNKNVNKLLGVALDTKYVSFSDFFTNPDNMSGYKLTQVVNEAIRKQPKDRNRFDNDIIKVDERVNIAYGVYTGSLMKFWPKPNDINNKWYSTIDALHNFSQKNSSKLREIAVGYFQSIDKAISTGNWSDADKNIMEIVKYQKFYGAEVYPSKGKIDAEIFYNHSNIFESLFPLYLLVGFVLLIFSFIKIVKPKFGIKTLSLISLVLLIVFFLAHTFGLGLRWYISGHAPWSNGYESMIYIAWATVLAGFVFSKKSSITMASTSILTGLILFVAHLNWMDPQVTNLVPVLNSYWLSIHVATITASYGFLALGALLGFITLLLFILINKKNEQTLKYSIKELNAINEMSLMIGLALLTVGNFLGGVWANESWGRYWGWDPKETWALVSILVYAVVVHLRFIKSIYSEFYFSVVALLSFTTVLMTYFGVNYYLAGMHSYAKGDPVPIPDFVPISYSVIFVVIVLAFRNKNRV